MLQEEGHRLSELRHKSHASNQRNVVHLPGHGRQALDDLESFQQVWTLTQFSSNYKKILGGQIVKKSFIRLEGKSMIPHRDVPFKSNLLKCMANM